MNDEPELHPGDRITYRNTDGTTSTGVLKFRTRKPGMSGLTCWAVDWDDIGIGVAPVDMRVSLAETNQV